MLIAGHRDIVRRGLTQAWRTATPRASSAGLGGRTSEKTSVGPYCGGTREGRWFGGLTALVQRLGRTSMRRIRAS
jgi:hypothetical protein